jgi:hypothetical protein
MLTITEQKANDIIEDMKTLSKLFTDQISDLHEMKGGIPMRHCFVYYRERLQGITDALVGELKEVKQQKEK